MNKVPLPPHLIRKAFSHGEMVRMLYKECLKNARSNIQHVLDYRYQCILIRQRFDENKEIKDFSESKRIVEEGWAELKSKMHPQPFQFNNCPGGIAYNREDLKEDYLLDSWHPMEKAQYPDYFKRRDIRKKEYMERWNQKFGVSEHQKDHH